MLLYGNTAYRRRICTHLTSIVSCSRRGIQPPPPRLFITPASPNFPRRAFSPCTLAPSQAKLARTGEALDSFLAEKRVSGRPVVCITAGGTAVPLEANTVRTIDNFSTGRRGAVSAE